MATQHGAIAPARNLWQLDPNHTQVEFAVKHMMVTTVKSYFKDVRGTILFDEADPSSSSLEAEIATASLHSGIDLRDQHVKGPQFLDVANHPAITFKSTRVELLDSTHANVFGNLTIRGITHEVTMETELMGRVKGPSGQDVIGFEARTQVNRHDFGMTLSTLMETGGVVAGDIVKIEIAAEAHKLSV